MLGVDGVIDTMEAAQATCTQGAGSASKKDGSYGGQHRCVLAWPLALSTLDRVQTALHCFSV
jgi:hypothetical protein